MDDTKPLGGYTVWHEFFFFFGGGGGGGGGVFLRIGDFFCFAETIFCD